ncbi:DC-STAMP domain-containing protein 2-like [Mya arenaria]|uniref:DC-STAMP domain-containing protein 2-like n=1 Tax=Mya arenaria TaxID=6604 RepID=UPI0022E3D920|nr:DC-STAMP domain-containing protein 2-like [Mya arenaria]
MATIQKIIQAIKIKLILNRLSKAKENAMREFLGLPPKMSWYDDCTSTVSMCIKDKLCLVFCPCCMYDRNRHQKVPSCWNSLFLKEFVGFLGGVLLTLLVYLMMIFQLEVPARKAAYISAVLGAALTLFLAFSQLARCLVLLMLPQLFSSKGRMLLLIYALILAMNNPLRNVNRNINVMSQSTTCGQEMALNETKELVKAAVAPMQGIMDSVDKVLGKLTDFANTLKATYTTLKKTVSEIGAVIKRVAQWLKSTVDTCNRKMGSPYRKCKNLFEDAYNDCKKKLGAMGFLCEIASLVGKVCNVVRVGELLCFIVDAIRRLLESAIDLPTQRVLKDAEEMFYFNVSLNYTFNYTFSQSRSYKQIKEDISREIHAHLDMFVDAIGVFRNVMVLTALFVIIKAVMYRQRWLSNDRFDNIHITFTVRDLDERRKDASKPGIVPLTYEEERKYIGSLLGPITRRERRRLGFGLVVFIVSMFNAAFYLFCDFGLYSALRIVQKNFAAVSKAPVPPHTKLHVVGQGPMADMYKTIVGMFDPISKAGVTLDVSPCVPNPSEPDWGVYKTIGLIYFLCLLLTIGEAYGLRCRHVIMACYEPRRERRRAIWLFNHIMKTRGGLMEQTKQKIKARKLGNAAPDHISLKGRLAANYAICEKLLKFMGWEVKSCLYCGREGKPDDYYNFIHCDFYDCDAVYCLECYADLNNKCPVCDNAVQVANIGSDSDEVDSSIDVRQKRKAKKRKARRDKRLQEIQAQKRPSKVMAKFRTQFGMPGNVNMNRPIERESRMYDCDDVSGCYVMHDKFREYNLMRPTVGLQLDVRRKVQSRDYSNSSSEATEDDDVAGDTLIDISGNNFYFDGQGRGHRKLSGNEYNNRVRNRRSLNITSSSDDDVTSGSSIDTDDLDFSYQSRKSYSDTDFHSDEEFSTLEDEPLNHNNEGRRYNESLDLVTEDIYTSSSASSDTDETQDSEAGSDMDSDMESLIKQRYAPVPMNMYRE